MTYVDLVKSLPAPQTKEEQYIYALVCSVANVENKNKLSDSPFYRQEQYWRAFYTVMSARLGEFLSTTPGTDEVNNAAIQNYSVSTTKLTTQVEARLLGEKRVTEAMLVDVLAAKLLANGRITENMLVAALAAKLLGSGRVTYDTLSPDLKAKMDTIVVTPAT